MRIVRGKPPTITASLASFAAQLDLGSVPKDVRERAKLHILDTIGCGIAGSRSGLATKALAYLAVEHSPGPCKVLARAEAFGPAAAAFANATAMNALDFDDGFEDEGRGMGHPGATIVAAALSAAWLSRAHGAAVLAAVIAAYEINNRLIASMQPSPRRFRQVYGVCQHQSVGAAIAFGRLTGLNACAMENVLGFAATLAHVPSLHKYNWASRPLVSLKDFNAPAARAGVQAVQLHQAGLIGAKDVFGGPTGYWRMAGSDRFAPEVLAGGLGRQWTLRSNSVKPFPACRWLHTALEGFANLRDAHALAAEEIEEVVVRSSRGVITGFLDADPKTEVDAQFSLPYVIAMLALRVPMSSWYADEHLCDPVARSIGRRVAAVVDPEADTLFHETRVPAAAVAVKARGRVVTSRLIRQPLGGRRRPLAPSCVVEKFHGNVDVVLGRTRAERLARELMALESVGCLADLLAASAHPA